MLFIKKNYQRLAVVGLGGMGKTQVALQLAYGLKDDQPDYSVFWVPAMSDLSFSQAYEEIARQLKLESDNNDDDPKKSLKRHLSSEAAGKWLLVVDNADDSEVLFGSSENPGGLQTYLPESDNGIILFTTRSREVAVSVAEHVLDLQEMDEQEATSFLGKKLLQKQPPQNEAAVKDLLQQLTYLPLAIAQAVAYMNRNGTSIQKYLELLRNTEEDLVGLMSREFKDTTRYPGSQNAVVSTWIVSFDQIRISDRVLPSYCRLCHASSRRLYRNRFCLSNAQTRKWKVQLVRCVVTRF